MIVMAQAKKYAIQCRCGLRTIWRIPADIVQAITSDEPMGLEYRHRKQENGHMIVVIHEIYFECKCKRVFEFSKDGVKNLTDGKDLTNKYEKFDDMVRVGSAGVC